jgi:hypothetical protein
MNPPGGGAGGGRDVHGAPAAQVLCLASVPAAQPARRGLDAPRSIGRWRKRLPRGAAPDPGIFSNRRRNVSLTFIRHRRRTVQAGTPMTVTGEAARSARLPRHSGRARAPFPAFNWLLLFPNIPGGSRRFATGSRSGGCGQSPRRTSRAKRTTDRPADVPGAAGDEAPAARASARLFQANTARAGARLFQANTARAGARRPQGCARHRP